MKLMSAGSELDPQPSPPTQFNCVPIPTQLNCVPPPPPTTYIPIDYEKEQYLCLFLYQECHTDIIWNGIINFNARLNECALLPTNILQYVGNISHKSSSNNLYFITIHIILQKNQIICLNFHLIPTSN